ncbi:MAG: hypothetical protein KAJ49_05110, partial [Arcobacteraceae bacterium]|nr:hypothetical protein [Arcobacteraceae bacterium]
ETALDSCWYSNDSGVTNYSATCGVDITGLASNEGSNTWYVYANDTTGNENSDSVTFTQDIPDPTISIDYPTNTTYPYVVTELNYTVSNEQACWYSNDSGTTNYTMTCGVDVTGLASNEGGNEWYVYANNSVDELALDSVSFTQDTIAPTFEFVYPVNETHYDVNITQFSYVIYDVSAFGTCWYSLDLGVTNNTITCGNNVTGLQVGDDGNYTWYVYGNDTFGNEGFGEVYFVIDKITPVLTWYDPTTSVSVTSSPYTINVSAYDPYLDATNVTVYAEGGSIIYTNFSGNLTETIWWMNDAVTIQEGLNTLEICARDSLTESPVIEDDAQFTKRNAEETEYVMPDGNVVVRELVIKDEFNNKLDAGFLNLITTEEWIDGGRHYKTTWEFDDIGTGFMEIVMYDDLGHLELKTDRGVTRVIDTDRNYYWSFGDMESAGYDLEYTVVSPNQIEIKATLGSYVVEGGRWIVDPIVAGLNTICENETIRLDTIPPSAESGGGESGGGGTSPVNDSYTKVAGTNFTVNASDVGGIENVTIIITNESDDIINQTTQEGYGATEIFFGFFYNLWYEGVYKWFFRIVDVANNIFETPVSQVTYDITTPSGVIYYPLNTSYDHQITEMNVSFNDTNIDSCWYNAGAGNVTITDETPQTDAPHSIKVSLGSATNISFVNDSDQSTSYDFTSNGIRFDNLNHTIPKTRSQNVRWLMNFSNDATLYTGNNAPCSSIFEDVCYWNWSDNSWEILHTQGSYAVGNHLLNLSLPDEAISNNGKIIISTAEYFNGVDQNASFYETWIDYTLEERDCLENITGLSSSEGSNTWYFWIEDAVNLVNESSVTFIHDTTPPTISITSPIDNNNYDTTSILVDITTSDVSSDVDSVWFFDGSSNVSYTSPFNHTFPEANITMIVYANDTLNNINSTSINFITDVTLPIVDLITVENISTNSFPSNFSMNYSINDTNIDFCSYNLDEILDVSNTDDMGGGFNSVNMATYYNRVGINFSLTDVKIDNITFRMAYGTSPAGNISLTFRDIETDTPLYEKDFGAVTDFVSDTYSWLEFNISDSPLITEPIYILIERDTTETDYVVVMTSWTANPEVFDFINTIGYNFNQTQYNTVGISDTSDPPIIIDFEDGYGTLYSLDCSETSANASAVLEGHHNLTIFGQDLSGNVVNDTEPFYVFLHEYVQDASEDIVAEGELITFDLVVDMTEISDTVAYLNYEGVDYLADSFNIVGDTYEFTIDTAIPDGTGNTTGKVNTWYWKYSTEAPYGTDFEDYTTFPQTQTVFSVEIDDCSVYTDIILYFDLNDEETDTTMNISKNPVIEANVQVISLGDEDIYWEFNQTYNDTSGSICIPNTLLNQSSYRFDAVLSYVADDYAKEFWYIDNSTLQAGEFALDDYTNRNITLRDLTLDDSLTFLFKYYDENYLIHEGAVVTLLRNYIGEGLFKEVERCLLDDNGECHLHLVEEDVIYQFRIVDDGALEYLSGEYNAKCLGSVCSITLQKGFGVGEWDEELDRLDEGTYTLTSDKADRTVTLGFNLEETGEIQLDVFVYSNVINSPDELVISDDATAKTGSIEVIVPLSYGNQTYYAVVRHNGDFVASEWIDMTESGYHYFGNLGLFLGALLVLTLGLIAVSSGGWTIAFLLIGLLVASITKLIDMDFYLLMWVISAGGLIIWKLSTRRSI